VPETVPVEVTGVAPEVVAKVQNIKNPKIQPQDRLPSLPPDTTFQQDLNFQGQRKINLIWESTQAAIAVVVVLCNMIVATHDGVYGRSREHPVILSSSLFLIIGFYFSRTNHTAIGGIGRKDDQMSQPYRGR
jgi:hypothetical protein